MARHLGVEGIVRQLKQAGISASGRVVCFNDPILPKLNPDRAVIDTRPGHAGQVWNLHKGRNTWLNPYDEKDHDLLITLARPSTRARSSPCFRAKAKGRAGAMPWRTIA